jgi:pimeloyl-ACP methyl ester carboxylesterase
LKACNNYKDGEKAIKKINCPTLCIFGNLDKMVTVKAGLKMAEQIKKSETKIIQDSGHMIIFEKAFEMRKLVKEFIIN